LSAITGKCILQVLRQAFHKEWDRIVSLVGGQDMMYSGCTGDDFDVITFRLSPEGVQQLCQSDR